jgi:hypothetical protein
MRVCSDTVTKKNPGPPSRGLGAGSIKVGDNELQRFIGDPQVIII